MPQFSLIETELRDDLALVKLNRPEKRNAISDALVDELGLFFADVPKAAKAVILHGEGAHFCAGLDLVERMATLTGNPMDDLRTSRTWYRVFDLMQFGDVPVISVLKGGVIGGGLELAASTHVRVAEQSAYFQLPEGQRGIFVGGSGSVRIPRIIGAGRMVEMMLTGRTYSAEEGREMALCHHVVPDGAGLDKALELGRAIASNALASNYAIINGIARIAEMSVNDGLFAESMVAAFTGSATDAKERVAAFFAGRKAKRDGEQQS